MGQFYSGEERNDLEVFGRTVLVPKREQAGLSQMQLAKIVGITQSWLCRIEQGKRPGNSATMLRWAEAIKLTDMQLTVWFDLVRDIAVSLVFKPYSRFSPEFDLAVTIGETQPGDMVLVKDGISQTVEPVSVIEERVFSLPTGDKVSPSYIRTLLKNRKLRIQENQRQITEGLSSFREICFLSGFDRYVVSGILSDFEWLDHLGGEPETPKQRIKRLKNLLLFLPYDNYELGLSDDPEGLAEQAIWEVKARREAYLETHLEDEHGTPLQQDYRITDLTTVRSLQERFENMWNSLGEKKDKRFVISHIEQRLAHLQQAA